jgi:hypothetical protein
MIAAMGGFLLLFKYVSMRAEMGYHDGRELLSAGGSEWWGVF